MLRHNGCLHRGYDRGFGFSQCDVGDRVNVIYLAHSYVTILLVVLSEALPFGTISNHVLRIMSDQLKTTNDVKKAFDSDGLFKICRFLKTRIL